MIDTYSTSFLRPRWPNSYGGRRLTTNLTPQAWVLTLPMLRFPDIYPRPKTFTGHFKIIVRVPFPPLCLGVVVFNATYKRIFQLYRAGKFYW